ncbi:hypothetical protein BDV95DRAFT_601738 [Massariosphaeria phaeospora]|uniref:Uncharacterized protein n=1 Tax=Massariosphaeria phaeospora TaxID=100035 RepID=A0A7C8ILM7_9PLEO|nr:hypothetical protein BDV95DRAFT_601738 [Massariosphaeria phaeospora]
MTERISKVFSHLARKKTPPPQTKSTRGIFPFMELPAEIRLQIYPLVSSGYLPWAEPSDYMGLFLSCAKIHDEMEHEAIKAAPQAVQEQQDKLECSVSLHPQGMNSLAELRKFIVEVPLWALAKCSTGHCYSRKQNAMVQSLQPLMVLHLTSVTVQIQDEPVFGRLTEMRETMSRDEWAEFIKSYSGFAPIKHQIRVIELGLGFLHLSREQSTELAIHNVENPLDRMERGDRYRYATTYTNIVPFATRLNCLISPKLCEAHKDQHHAFNNWCIYARGGQVRHTPHADLYRVKVKKLTLELKKLDRDIWAERKNADVYGLPFVNWVRWNPAMDGLITRKYGWVVRWEDKFGLTGPWFNRRPARFIWYKDVKKIESGYMDDFTGIRRALY